MEPSSSLVSLPPAGGSLTQGSADVSAWYAGKRELEELEGAKEEAQRCEESAGQRYFRGGAEKFFDLLEEQVVAISGDVRSGAEGLERAESDIFEGDYMRVFAEIHDLKFELSH